MDKFSLTDETMTEDELEVLAEQALQADIELKEATERAKALKQQFKDALEAQGKLGTDFHGIGPVRTIIKHVRRFDEATARQALTDEEIEKYSVKKLDSALLKKNYAPTVYEELFSKDYGFSLEFRVGD